MDIFLKSKFFLKKNKFILLGIFLFLFILYYFFFLREIRNINFSINKLQIEDNEIKTDFNYDFYVRSKLPIVNIKMNYKIDFNKDSFSNMKYYDFFKDYSINETYGCIGGNKCSYKGDKNNFLNIITSIYSFNKIDTNLYDFNEKEIDLSSLLPDDIPTSVISSDLDIINDFLSPQDSNSGILNVDNNRSPEFDNSFKDIDTTIIINESGLNEKKSLLNSDIINCKKLKYKNHPDCYVTPKMDIGIKGIKLFYTILFVNGDIETGEIYKELFNSYMKISGDTIIKN